MGEKTPGPGKTPASNDDERRRKLGDAAGRDQAGGDKAKRAERDAAPRATGASDPDSCPVEGAPPGAGQRGTGNAVRGTGECEGPTEERRPYRGETGGQSHA